MHSQHNLLLPGAMLGASRGYGPSLRKGDFLPLTILNMQVLTTLTHRAGGWVLDRLRPQRRGRRRRVDPRRAGHGLERPARAHPLARQMDAVAPDDLASLDEVWNGGGDCPEPVRAAFEEKFGKPRAHHLRAERGADRRDHRRLATARTCVGGERPAAARISTSHDASTTRSASARRPPAVGGRVPPDARLLGPPRRHRRDARDGLLHTGDLGFVDDDGFLHIRDRKSLVIIRGGGNVYPAEIERVLHERDEVGACAVVGSPTSASANGSARGGTAPGRDRRPRSELRAHCLANLAKYKVPERWVFVDGFPRNSMGKIQRRELGPLFEP